VKTALEGVTEQYSESLFRLIEALKVARTELRELRSYQALLESQLRGIGRVLSFQPESDGTDQALSYLEWVLRSTNETVKRGEDALTGVNEALPDLDARLRSVIDLISNLRMASAPEVEEPVRKSA
jgi:hypothetical protein